MVDKKNALMSRRAATRTEEVEITKGLKVTVRALTREEVASCKNGKGKDATMNENLLISKALIDPAMTEEEVTEWMTGAPAGDSVTVMDAVGRLSGMNEGAAKRNIPKTGKRN